jgi:hypothetical protein
VTPRAPRPRRKEFKQVRRLSSQAELDQKRGTL